MRVRDDGASEPRIGLGHGDGDTGQHRAALVRDAAAQLCGGKLRPGCCGRNENRERANQRDPELSHTGSFPEGSRCRV